jgi:DNA-binding response OmpR family regulator
MKKKILLFEKDPALSSRLCENFQMWDYFTVKVSNLGEFARKVDEVANTRFDAVLVGNLEDLTCCEALKVLGEVIQSKIPPVIICNEQMSSKDNSTSDKIIIVDSWPESQSKFNELVDSFEK